MSDQEPKKVLSLGERKPTLALKKAVPSEGGARGGLVRQSFSHGRFNTVEVERKRKRTEGSGAPGGEISGAAGPGPVPVAQSPDKQSPPSSGTPAGAHVQTARPTTTALRHLTPEEREARVRALRGAVIEGNDRRKSLVGPHAFGLTGPSAESSADSADGDDSHGAAPSPLSERERLRQREMEELESIQAHERSTNERATPSGAVGASAKVAPRAGESTTAKADVWARRGLVPTEDEGSSAGRRGKGGLRAGAGARRSGAGGAGGDSRRRTGRLTITQALTEDEGGRRRSMASLRRRMERERRLAGMNTEATKVARDVTLPEIITVQELANRMAERAADVIKALMKMGVMATITQNLDADTAELVATEFGHHVHRVTEADVEANLGGNDDEDDVLLPRPPIVTVMGHVDHGKTSLLDAFRQTNVVSGEAGGITQHIGAYQVILAAPVHGFDRITFIDTPGHAAFTEMRARGANVTDVVVLVVAADDSVMPQTIEAIRHAKAANVPIVVAINKCDLPAANPARVKQELLQHDIQVEDMGGEVLSVEISAKKRQGLDKLEDAILLQAEIMALKANPHRPAQGAVIESRLEKGRGTVATVLVQRGTLRVGDILVAGGEWGRVRALVDDHGKSVTEAGPAMPIEVLGLNGAPIAGDELVVVDNEARAREIAEFRQRRRRALATTAQKRGTLEQMMANIKTGALREMPILIKGDAHGSVEAIKTALVKLTAEHAEVRVRILDAAVGAVTESDITLARASGGLVIGFNVRANPQAREMARRDSVEIRYYSVIYTVIDDVKSALSGMLSPELRETSLGSAEILQVFTITNVGKIAGCRVTNGLVRRGAKARLVRDNVVVYDGTVKTLRRVKDDVKEVRDGLECGMAFENYTDFAVGDVIECFEIEEVARAL